MIRLVRQFPAARVTTGFLAILAALRAFLAKRLRPRHQFQFLSAYKASMRRLNAILLILLLGGVPAFSALEATFASSDLPACCKKDGAHMCAMRHGRTKQEDGNAKLFAYCPFAGKATPAVPGQRVGNVVEANSVVAPLAASNLDAKAPAFVFA
jgi:hypothetical protein